MLYQTFDAVPSCDDCGSDQLRPLGFVGPTGTFGVTVLKCANCGWEHDLDADLTIQTKHWRKSRDGL